MANFVWVSARFLTYKIYLRQFCSPSPEAMPPKSKVQPSNPDRVTRSQRAPVPNIPLPPRREPPTRKKAVSFVIFTFKRLSDDVSKPPPPSASDGISSPAAPSRPRPVPRPITRNKPRTSEEEDHFFISSRAGWKPLETNQIRKCFC